MLKTLELKGVGPAPSLKASFAKRINLITGDNGMGKSFLLDLAWWALTRTWAGQPARPRTDTKSARVDYSIQGVAQSPSVSSTFRFDTQSWSVPQARPSMPGLVVYAQVDGSFSVWDPIRNYWKQENDAGFQRPPAYRFTNTQIWDGLRDGDRIVCNGLIRDWASWQDKKNGSFKLLSLALKSLSPDDGELLTPGPLVRIGLDDVRDTPTLHMPYGEDVPVTLASAAIRRILALAYLLVWAWQEHIRASEITKRKPAKQIVFLIDEIECHLHPRWQRSILESLLKIVTILNNNKKIPVQLLVATHSPLIVASLEPFFDPATDKLIDLDLSPANGAPSQVTLKEVTWERRGGASDWLKSELFDMKSDRSLPSEKALARAAQFMASTEKSQREFRAISKQLEGLLRETDPFWLRWEFLGEKLMPAKTGKESMPK